MELQEPSPPRITRKTSVLGGYNYTGKTDSSDLPLRRFRKTSSLIGMQLAVRKVSQEERSRKNSSSFYSSLMDQEQGHKSKTPVVIENTFQTEPVATFPYDRVRGIIEDTLETHLEDRTYEPRTCAHMTALISDELKTKVKAIGIPRYRIVSVVHIGSMKGQDVKVASRCLWNCDVDTFAAASYRSTNIFAVAMVYGIYLE